MHLTRRHVLQTATLGALSALLPESLSAFDGFLRIVRSDRILILLELEGGNDALNMLVPYTDTTYKAKRPTYLKLSPTSSDWRSQVIPFSTWSSGTALTTADGFGVHAGLDPLKPAW